MGGRQPGARADADAEKLVAVEDVIEQAIRVAWNEIKFKCEIEKEYGDTPPIVIRENQILQVFLNLLINAAQAIPHRGTIKVGTAVSGNRVVAVVQDSGDGIAPDHLTKIFDPFFTTKEVGKGPGLGLSVAQHIIDAHGGTIEAESEPGKGTSFKISLPLRASA